MCASTLFDAMAADLSVERYKGERDEAFFRRVAYTALRPLAQAACMDDGEGAARGVAPQALSRRLGGWADAMGRVVPGLGAWLREKDGIRRVVGRLADLGDLAAMGPKGRLRATPARLEPQGASTGLVVGFFDQSDKTHPPCGLAAGTLVTSGLATLASDDRPAPARPPLWWEAEAGHMVWEDARSVGDVAFADPRSSWWFVSKDEVWGSHPDWLSGLALARGAANVGPPEYYLARKRGARTYLARTSRPRAQELFLWMHAQAGCPAKARVERLDGFHAMAKAPVGFLPGWADRVADALGWPLERASCGLSRVVRVEAVPLLVEVLGACGVETTWRES